MHVCPMVTPGVPPIPHVGGPILPAGAPTVLIGMLPAARVTDMAMCVGPPDVIVKGSMTVLIGSLPAARMGDMTAHGGSIVLGEMTVMIGDSGSGERTLSLGRSRTRQSQVRRSSARDRALPADMCDSYMSANGRRTYWFA